MATYTQGTWGIGGLKLPDFGLTEWLSGGTGGSAMNNPNVYKAANTTQQQYSQDVNQNNQYALSQQGQAVNPFAPYKSTTAATIPTGGNGGGGSPTGGSPQQVQQPSGGQDVNALNEQVRNEISGAYDQYFAGLDQQLGTIGDQRTQQEGIVQSQQKQGMNTLDSQKTQGLQDLGGERIKNTENQVKTLQDLADNIRNQFQAGRLNLGARGAGDSSAANQYSYAIAKMGNKSRGDVLGQTRSIENEIANREFKLKNIYDTETKNLQETTNQKILEVANWFSSAQQQIQQMKSQGQLAKGQDLASLSKNMLQQAQNALLMAQQEAANKRTALDQWAMNNATSINQLKTNMASTSQYATQAPVRQNISGQIQQDSAGNVTGPQLTGYSSNWGSSKLDQWGNPITT